MIKIKHYRNFTCEPLGDKPVIDVMWEGCELLDNLKLTHWVSAGSALGLAREPCGYIKYDTDIDVEVLVDENFDELKLRRYFAKNDFEIIRRMCDDDKVMQLAFMSQDIIFDIYFYYDTNTSNYANKNEHGELLIPKRFVNNRQEYKSVICPHPINEYLEYRYGVSWRIPTNIKMNWNETTGEALK